jgi:glutaredoxin
MKKWIVLVIIVVIIQKWDVITAKPIDVNADVVMYTTEWCPYCKKARSFLDENNVKYVEYDIEKSSEGRAKYNNIGGRGIPVLVINGSVLNGYNPKKIINLLKET